MGVNAEAGAYLVLTRSDSAEVINHLKLCKIWRTRHDSNV